ncbi:MAG: hypothetical protein U0414_04365 [Polyangiaceae bacterium]
MKRTTAFTAVAAVLATVVASTAEARPPEAGDWDPRFSPPILVTDRPTQRSEVFDWWTASFSERKSWLEKRYAVPPRAAAIAATGGMPLSPIDSAGRGAFLTPCSLGASVVLRW